ncbi:SHD1 domain-containing protein [Thermopirellula anaerolimosa]
MKAVIFLVCVLLLVASAAAEVRTWKDKTGKFSIRAELVESDGTTVKLKRADGKVISVPVDRLSDQDRQFLEAQEKSAFGGAAPGEAGKMAGAAGAGLC